MKRPRIFGVIKVPGYADAKVTNATVAAYIDAQQAEIARLRTIIEQHEQGEPRRPLIVLPGRMQ